jgi:hypothetical protein
MKLIILYRPNSEYARRVEEFIANFNERHDKHPAEVINVDSREGVSTATLYDVVQYPAILVVGNDGGVQKIWQGPELPLVNEVAGYVNS